jgi:molecular chaperone DnaK
MDIILGIDFGTTSTVISYFENNKPNILLDGVFKTIKSKIGIKDNNYTCGNYISLNSDEIIHSFKSQIGEADQNKNLLIFFDHLKKLIQKKFPNYNLKAVITVPSNFNDIQREVIRNNFIITGFDIIRIINEPSAAALAYGLSLPKNNEDKILVIDLGGGTLDLTILLTDDGFFEVLHSIGLNDLGGNNFTKVIYDYILKNNKDFDKSKLNQLWYACQNAKEKLSWLDNYEIKINDFIFNLNIKQFENLCNPLIERLEKILIDINNSYTDIEHIIMVGNSSKIPIIKILVEKIFKIKPWLHPNLESVVAEGACLYGAIIENKYITDKNIILVDVLPLSLGVETIDGNFSVIIPKNTPLPIKRTQRYTTDTPSENSIKIKIYQGERLIANKNTLIGEFIFDKISIGGIPQIDITFKVDSNSIITVIITDKKSGIEKNILIKNITILNDEEIEQIINLANSNNKLDEEEMTKYNRIYLLNTKIEIAMNNITLNYLLDENKKKEILNELCQIESEILLADNVKLLKLLTIIDEKYLNLTQNNIDSLNNTDYSDLEKLMLIELKNELNSKIIFLLNKNSEWDEYLTPIIEKLTLANISLEYIQDKLEIIKELEDEDENIILYKDQFKSLCLFIKNQIEEDIISLDSIKMDTLILLVNDSLHLIENDNNANDNNTNDKYWEIKLMDFNKKCEEFLNF